MLVNSLPWALHVRTESWSEVIPKSSKLTINDSLTDALKQFKISVSPEPENQPAFKFATFRLNDEKQCYLLEDMNKQQPVEIYTQISDSEEAAFAVTFYVKNALHNNSGLDLEFFYNYPKLKLGGQIGSETMLASDKSKCRIAFAGS